MHQKEKRSMDHFAGLDVSVKETSICIVDDTGRIVREVKVASEPEALLQELAMAIQRTRRSGLTGYLCRDAAYAGGPKGADQQDGSQRRSRDGADDAGWALSTRACEDATQPEADRKSTRL